MIETLVALNVQDEQLFSKYCERVTPLLKEYEGSLTYNRVVEENRNDDSDDEIINHILILQFGSEELKNAFHNNNNYRKAKKELFDKAVKSMFTLSSHQI